MCKIKKSMAVLLSALMLASFMPLFASAAVIQTSPVYCTLVEAPKLSLKGAEPVSNLTVPYGTSKADIEIVGGKVAYKGTEVDGSFTWVYSETNAPSTAALAIGAVAVSIYFHPTDTSSFKTGRSAWNSGENWPTITVAGLDGTLVEAPTASSVGTGATLSKSVISGGKVTNADGEDVTSSGAWAWTDASIILDSPGTFEYDAQWTATGYNAPVSSKVTVTVTQDKAELLSSPVFPATDSGTTARTSIRNVTAGVVTDKDGNDITSAGSWSYTYTNGDTLATSDYLYADTEVVATWTAIGYNSVSANATIPVNQVHEKYEIVSAARFTSKSVPWSDTVTFEDIIVPGVIKDKTTNETVSGRYEIYSSATADEANRYTGSIYIMSSKNLYIHFIPDDTALESIYFICKLAVVKGTFTPTEDFEIVLNYGASYRMPLEAKDLTFSNLSVTPANDYTNVYTIYWSLDEFDPKTADYGSVTYVNATITPEFPSMYNTLTNVKIPVRIQNYQIANVFAIAGSELGAYIASGEGIEDADEGIITYTVNFTNARLKGEVKVSATDGTDTFDVATVTPDETGKFYVLDKWQAPADGDYTFTYTYIPSEEDTASFTDEKYLTVNALKAVSVDMKEFRTITVKVGSDVFTQKVREGKAFWIEWEDLTDTDPAVFDHWVITDANGKECTAKSRTGGDFDTTDKTVNIVVGATDLTFTAATASGDTDMDSASGGALGSLWDFWQKLINFIIEIYTQIMNVFVPSVEQGW